MSVTQWAGILLGGLILTAMGIDGMRLRERSGMTKREIRIHDAGYLFGAKFFFVSGLISSAVAGIGLLVTVLLRIIKALTA